MQYRREWTGCILGRCYMLLDPSTDSWLSHTSFLTSLVQSKGKNGPYNSIRMDSISMCSMDGSVVEFSPATRGARVQFPVHASTFPNGACTFWDPLSLVIIPSWNVQKCLNGQIVENKTFVGDGGYRSPYLSHAKRALYHLSYVPMLSHSLAERLSDIQKWRAYNVVAGPGVDVASTGMCVPR